jgi:hypothetical protein
VTDGCVVCVVCVVVGFDAAPLFAFVFIGVVSFMFEFVLESCAETVFGCCGVVSFVFEFVLESCAGAPDNELVEVVGFLFKLKKATKKKNHHNNYLI